MDSDIKLPKVFEQKGGKNLVASMEINGFMPDHLNTVLWFLRVSAMKMLIPNIIIHLPTDKTTWVVNKGHFVHAKTKGSFWDYYRAV